MIKTLSEIGFCGVPEEDLEKRSWKYITNEHIEENTANAYQPKLTITIEKFMLKFFFN